MRSDDEIKRDVEDELRWDPDIDETDIAVAVKDGVVTLSGFARSYGQRRAAEAAAKRVAGVLGVANDLEVRLPIIHRRPETERMSHYFGARLPEQFDAVLHFDETRAVEPLEYTAEWEAGEPPETFPFGV